MPAQVVIDPGEITRLESDVYSESYIWLPDAPDLGLSAVKSVSITHYNRAYGTGEFRFIIYSGGNKPPSTLWDASYIVPDRSILTEDKIIITIDLSTLIDILFAFRTVAGANENITEIVLTK